MHTFPENVEITLVRHGQSVSNQQNMWQGQGDAELSSLGQLQAKHLGEHIHQEDFDLCISSDLTRAHRTAQAVTSKIETHPAWREINIGRWEGLTKDEVAKRFPEELRALQQGEPLSIGGGESWVEFHARISSAFAKLLTRVSSGQRILIVAHGGVIHSLLSGLLGNTHSKLRTLGWVANTAVTKLRTKPKHIELLTFNNTVHLAKAFGWAQHIPRDVGHNTSMLAIQAEGDNSSSDSPLSQASKQVITSHQDWYLPVATWNTNLPLHSEYAKLFKETLFQTHQHNDDALVSMILKRDQEDGSTSDTHFALNSNAVLHTTRNILDTSKSVLRLAQPSLGSLSHIISVKENWVVADYNLYDITSTS